MCVAVRLTWRDRGTDREIEEVKMREGDIFVSRDKTGEVRTALTLPDPDAGRRHTPSIQEGFEVSIHQ